MERVTPHISAGAVGHLVVAGPVEVLHIRDKSPRRMGHGGLVLVGFIIGDFVTVLAAVVGVPFNLIPFVSLTGHTVAIDIHAHHDHARLTTAARHSRHRLALDRITIDLHIIAMLVDHRMVKTKDDIATETAQAHRSAQLAAQGALELSIDAVLCITRFVGRKHVDKLSRCGQKVIHPRDVRRVVCSGRHRGGYGQCEK